MDVAAAAVRLIERASGAPGEDEPEIPAVAAPPPPRRAAPARGAGPARYSFGGRDAGTSARIFIGAGRAAGMRPADLVGAIANEAKANPRDIGAIQIADRFSLVEVPEAIAESVIKALRSATLRGQKVVVRRDREKA